MFNRIIKISTVVILILLISASGYLYYRNNKLAQQADNYKNNIEVLNDSVKTIKNKAGNYQYQKQAFEFANELKIQELKQLNRSLANKLKRQKNSKDVKYINESENSIKKDSFVVDTTTYIKKDSTANAFKFKHSDSSEQYEFNLDGEINFNTIYTDSGVTFSNINTTVNNINFEFDLIHGIKETQNKHKVFISSPYSGFKVRNMNSAIEIDKNQNKFVIGPSITTGYAIRNNSFDFVVGVSATLKIFAL
jgi:hypothetical protein